MTNSLNDRLLPAPIEEHSIGALFFEQARAQRNRPFARFRDVVDNQWTVYSWLEAAGQVAAVAEWLVKQGIGKGDRVGILGSTRFEWIVADLAILSVGAISVPIYHSLTPTEVGFLLWDADIRGIFVENRGQWRKVEEITATPVSLPPSEVHEGGTVSLQLRFAASFEDVGGVTRWSEIVPKLSPSEITFAPAQLSRQNVATIVYTSGTSGVPKGVVQTHGNHLAMLDDVARSGLLGRGERVFLYLPLAHSFARLIAYAVVAAGGDLILPTVVDRNESRLDARRLLDDVRRGAPYIFPSVPRIFEKVMETLRRRSGVQGKVVGWALDTVQRGSVPETTRRNRLARLVLSRVRKRLFGPRLRYGVSGGAPISVEVLEFFDRLGVTILEGYGLTETTPAISANTLQQRRVGSVGRPFECCEVRIDPADGEIIVRGPNIASGYWKRPQATAEAWQEGWFHTGDVGHIDEDGFLWITDRKKDLIVTAGGKKIPPTFLEGKLKLSPLISQAFVFGDRKPYLVALLTLDGVAVRELVGTSPSKEELQHRLRAEVDQVNRDFASFEQVKSFAILPEDFSVENGLLTPTLKLRRKEIATRYTATLAQLYRTGE